MKANTYRSEGSQVVETRNLMTKRNGLRIVLMLLLLSCCVSPPLVHSSSYVCTYVRTNVHASPRSVAIANRRNSRVGRPGLLAPPARKKKKMLRLNLLLFSRRGPRTFASPRGHARERLAACAAGTRSACFERPACSRRHVLSFRVCATTSLRAFSCATHRVTHHYAYVRTVGTCVCTRTAHEGSLSLAMFDGKCTESHCQAAIKTT